MKFEVYHAVEPTFGFGPKLVFPTDYEKVALIEAEDIGDTFRITNHIEHDWTTNPEVIKVYGRCRSTSVGDVMVNEDGTKFYCDMVGWKEI